MIRKLFKKLDEDDLMIVLFFIWIFVIAITL